VREEQAMSKVVVGLSVSLDGFIAGPNDGPGNPLGDGGGRLFEWWTAGTERLGTDGTVVTDGIESALEQARAVAGDRPIGVCAADVAQQYLNAGLLDEIHLSLVPVLLGGGVRLFDNIGDQKFGLECTRVVESDGVTHLSYRVVR
jgi:dihydrofolate reductase